MQPYHSPLRRLTLGFASALVSATALALVMTVQIAPAQASQAASTSAQEPVTVQEWKCRGLFPPRCGYQLSKGPTKTIMKAATLGGVAAAAVACSAIPGASAVVCAVIGAVSGVTLGDLVSGYTEGTCLFLAVPIELVDC